MLTTQLQNRLQQLRSEYIEEVYSAGFANHLAAKRLVDDTFYSIADTEMLDAHTYWSTDEDYYWDFNSLPRPSVWFKLHEAADAIKEASGVTVHLVDCSSGYAQ